MRDVISMSYTGRANSIFPLGCLPAALFGFVVGAPFGYAILMGECVDDSGGTGSCPSEGVELLALVAVTALMCFVIAWATNRMVAAFEMRGRASGWGIGGGFLLAAGLAGAQYTALVALT